MLQSSRAFLRRSTYNSVQKSYSVPGKKATSDANSFKTYEIRGRNLAQSNIKREGP